MMVVLPKGINQNVLSTSLLINWEWEDVCRTKNARAIELAVAILNVLGKVAVNKLVYKIIKTIL